MDAFRNDMHGRLLRDEIPVYDYLIELAPFALVFMTTRELSYIGACEQIIIGTRCGICDLRIFRKGLGSEYLGNTSVLRGIIEVSHNEYLRLFSCLLYTSPSPRDRG